MISILISKRGVSWSHTWTIWYGFFQRSERRTVSWFSNTRRDTRSVIYFLTVGKAREVASVTCAVLTFHHHTDDPVDGGRNIVERHTLVNPVTVSRDVVNNKGFAVNAHPYRKQQYVKKNGYPAIYWYTLRYQ